MAVSDSIVLELMARVQKCENDIKVLTETINSLKKDKIVSNYAKELMDDSEDGNDEEKNLTRSQARELIMNNMRKLLPGTVVRAGNRREGSGIVIVDTKSQRRFKLYHSKSYDISTDNTISWSGVLKSDLDDVYNGYIFSIWSNEQYVLLFTHQQLIDIIHATNKTCDTNNKFHFSFTITPDKKVFETRTPNYFEVSYGLENYKIIN